jgi:small subunit ribosomal protein S15
MLTKEHKEKIIKEFGRSDKDTGSCEVQIALLTARITQIADHLKSFPKDKHSRRGLIKLVSQRRSYMHYLKKQDAKRYEFVINNVEIKKKKNS